MRKALGIVIGLAIPLVGAFPVYAATPILVPSAGDLFSITEPSSATQVDFGHGSSEFSEMGISYYPTASKNLCTVSIAMKKDTASTTGIGSVRLEIRHLGINPATTTTGGTRLSDQGDHAYYADSQFQVASTDMEQYDFTFTPCATLVGAHWYNFIFTEPVDSYGYKIEAYTSPMDVGGSGAAVQIGRNESLSNTYKFALHSSNGINIIFNGSENFGAYDTDFAPSFGQSVIDGILGINDANASSSAMQGFANFWSLQGYLQSKFPFNYMFEIATAFSVLSYGTTTTSWTFSVPLTIGSSSGASLDVLPDVWDVITPTTIAVYYPDTVRLFFRNLLALVLTVGWAFYMFNRVRFLFK